MTNEMIYEVFKISCQKDYLKTVSLSYDKYMYRR